MKVFLFQFCLSSVFVTTVMFALIFTATLKPSGSEEITDLQPSKRTVRGDIDW